MSVEFETDESAARAVEETNGTEIFGGLVEVKIIPKKDVKVPVSKSSSVRTTKPAGWDLRVNQCI